MSRTLAPVEKQAIEAYEKYAFEFLKARDSSRVGRRTVRRWARTLKSNSNVLEIGCGGGLPVTKTLIASGLNVRAVDSSPTLVRVFRCRFPGIPVRCESVLESDLFQKTYDGVIAVGLIFLFAEDEQLKMLDRVSAALCPGGSFLFTAPVEAGEWDDTVTGHTCLALGDDAYRAALRRSGMDSLRCYSDSGKNNYYEVRKTVD